MTDTEPLRDLYIADRQRRHSEPYPLDPDHQCSRTCTFTVKNKFALCTYSGRAHWCGRCCAHKKRIGSVYICGLTGVEVPTGDCICQPAVNGDIHSIDQLLVDLDLKTQSPCVPACIPVDAKATSVKGFSCTPSRKLRTPISPSFDHVVAECRKAVLSVLEKAEPNRVNYHARQCAKCYTFCLNSCGTKKNCPRPTYIALALLYEMRRGLKVRETTVIPYDEWVDKNIVPLGMINSKNLLKPKYTAAVAYIKRCIVSVQESIPNMSFAIC